MPVNEGIRYMIDKTQWPHNGLPPTAKPIVYTEAEEFSFVKAAQIASLTASCGAAIVAGFPSSALGTAYTYPSQPNDQTNLIGAVAGGLATINFWCADSEGVWGFTAHTALQIKQVLADGGTQRMNYSAKLLDLVTKVNAAATVVDVQAVVW